MKASCCHIAFGFLLSPAKNISLPKLKEATKNIHFTSGSKVFTVQCESCFHLLALPVLLWREYLPALTGRKPEKWILWKTISQVSKPVGNPYSFCHKEPNQTVPWQRTVRFLNNCQQKINCWQQLRQIVHPEPKYLKGSIWNWFEAEVVKKYRPSLVSHRRHSHHPGGNRNKLWMRRYHYWLNLRPNQDLYSFSLILITLQQAPPWEAARACWWEGRDRGGLWQTEARDLRCSWKGGFPSGWEG